VMCYNLSETFRNVRHLKHKIVITSFEYNVMCEHKTYYLILNSTNKQKCRRYIKCGWF